MKKTKKFLLAILSLFILVSCHDSSSPVDSQIPSEDRKLVGKIKENEKTDGVFIYESYDTDNNQLIEKENLAYNNGENIRIEEFIKEGQDDIVYIFYPDHRLFLNKTKGTYFEGEYRRGLIENIFSNLGMEDDSNSIIEDYLNYNPDYQIKKEDDYTIIELVNGDYMKYDGSYKLVESLETSEEMKIKTTLVDEADDFDKFYEDCLKLKEQYKKVEDISEITGKG